MEGEATYAIQFPLDLSCPDCGAAPVKFTVRFYEESPGTADVNVACPCGRRINYGSVPLAFTGRTPAHFAEEQGDA